MSQPETGTLVIEELPNGTKRYSLLDREIKAGDWLIIVEPDGRETLGLFDATTFPSTPQLMLRHPGIYTPRIINVSSDRLRWPGP